MLELNAFLNEKNVEIRSKEINRKLLSRYRIILYLIKKSIYFFAIYKFEVGLKLDF